MTVGWIVGKIFEGGDCSLVDTLFGNFYGGTEENHEEHQSA
jgi:hypothetical protein